MAGIERNSRRELMAAVIHENYYGWWVRVHTCRPTDVVHNVCLSLEHQQRERESNPPKPFVCLIVPVCVCENMDYTSGLTADMYYYFYHVCVKGKEKKKTR